MKTILFLMALTALADAALDHSIRHQWNLKHRDSSGCASIEENCSEKPCCPYYNVLGFYLGTVHCFQFGVKVCRRERAISNRWEYFRLLDQLNSTNHQEMSNRYWSSLTTPPPTPQTTRRQTTRRPSLTLRFGR